MTTLRFREALFFLCQMTSLVVVCVGRVPICREPSSERMKNLTQMLLLGSNRWLTYDAVNVRSKAVLEVMPSKITGDISTNCPQNTNSTCPTYMVKETVPTRIPSVIMHARCACDQCQISGLRGKNKQRYMCEPLHRFLPVLKRQDVCVNGEYDYVIVQQRVAVSCHCVRKPITKKGRKKGRKSKSKKQKISTNHKSPKNFSK
ncbi:interleukin 17-like protein [Mizuhopecten yessoensis]|uniref:Interleukin 17-like protein n=1 Tax=Mizuhopecten yessoensis TaxID=6573 RepID=A0A210Q735_MIZYE|nr:interleukin 17-like protein [Mizuhopecten yessoensis]OWF44550.1 Interleukin 17-like protein [Mizuhopecten yessoensis]